MSEITDTSGQSAGGREARASWRFLKNHLREYGILFALIAIMAFFQIATGGILLRPINLTNLVLQNSYIVIMAIGMLLVIVAGHIDLSVGSVLGFIGALAAVMIVNWNMPYLLAGALCLVAGALIGAAQGFWIAYFRIPSFIVTLAGMLVFKGLTLWLLAGQSVGPFPPQFQLISSGFVPDFLGMDGFNLFSFVVAFAVAAGLSWMAIRNRAAQARTGTPEEPFAFFIFKTLLIFGGITYLGFLMAGFRGLFLCHQPHDDGPQALCHRRQREGGDAVGDQFQAADLSDLRQHGDAGRTGRSGLCRASEHGDAQGGGGVRA